MRISDWSSDVCSSVLPIVQSRSSTSSSKRLQQRLYIVHRNHADRLDLAARAALDHRAEHFAAELDELPDADVFHRADAFAPADAAGDLAHEQVADHVGVAEIGRAHV